MDTSLASIRMVQLHVKAVYFMFNIQFFHFHEVLFINGSRSLI